MIDPAELCGRNGSLLSQCWVLAAELMHVIGWPSLLGHLGEPRLTTAGHPRFAIASFTALGSVAILSNTLYLSLVSGRTESCHLSPQTETKANVGLWSGIESSSPQNSQLRATLAHEEGVKQAPVLMLADLKGPDLYMHEGRCIKTSHETPLKIIASSTDSVEKGASYKLLGGQEKLCLPACDLRLHLLCRLMFARRRESGTRWCAHTSH